MSHNILIYDNFVKRYLLFRGFAASCRSFETELKNEKERVYRVDKIMDQIQTSVTGHDLQGLREIWTFLELSFFAHLGPSSLSHLKVLEQSLYRFFLISCLQSNKPDKVKEFLDKLGSDLQGDPDWAEWFALPYKKGPEDCPTFSCYYSKQWQDSFLISLHNFLTLVVQTNPVPDFIQDDDSARKMIRSQDENRRLKEQVRELRQRLHLTGLEDPDTRSTFSDSLLSPGTPLTGASAMDLLDDFHGLSNDTEEEPSLPPPQKEQGIRGLFKTLGAGRSGSPTDSQGNGRKGEERNMGLLGRRQEWSAGKQEIKRNKEPPSTLSTKPRPEQQQQQQQRKTSSGSEDRPVYSGLNPSSSQSSLQAEGTGFMPLTRPADVAVATIDADSNMRARLSESHSFINPSPFVLLPQDHYQEHHAAVTQCRFSASGHTIASLDADGVVKVWNIQPSPVTMATVMSKSTLLSLEWASANGQLVLLGSKSGTVRLFDTAKKKIVGETVVSKDFQRVTSLCCATDLAYFVCSASGRSLLQNHSRAGQLSLWDQNTMKLVTLLSTCDSTPSVDTMAYDVTSGAHNLVTADEQGHIYQFDLRDKPSLYKHDWQAHGGGVVTVALHKDHCYSAGVDGKLREWTLHKPGTLVREMDLHQGACGPFVFEGAGGYRQVHTPKDRIFAMSYDSQHIITCSENAGLIYQNSYAQWQKVQQVGGHSAPVVAVDWSANTNTNQCLTGSMDGAVCVYTMLTQ